MILIIFISVRKLYVVGRFDHNGMINDRNQCLPSCRSTDFYKICTNITTYIQKCIYKPMIVIFTDSLC